MMTSSALVLFMTLPGLALFYGDWCGQKTYFQFSHVFGHRGAGNYSMVAFGYSLVFGTSFKSPYLGGSEYFFLKT